MQSKLKKIKKSMKLNTRNNEENQWNQKFEKNNKTDKPLVRQPKKMRQIINIRNRKITTDSVDVKK